MESDALTKVKDFQESIGSRETRLCDVESETAHQVEEARAKLEGEANDLNTKELARQAKFKEMQRKLGKTEDCIAAREEGLASREKALAEKESRLALKQQAFAGMVQSAERAAAERMHDADKAIAQKMRYAVDDLRDERRNLDQMVDHAAAQRQVLKAQKVS